MKQDLNFCEKTYLLIRNNELLALLILMCVMPFMSCVSLVLYIQGMKQAAVILMSVIVGVNVSGFIFMMLCAHVASDVRLYYHARWLRGCASLNLPL